MVPQRFQATFIFTFFSGGGFFAYFPPTYCLLVMNRQSSGHHKNEKNKINKNNMYTYEPSPMMYGMLLILSRRQACIRDAPPFALSAFPTPPIHASLCPPCTGLTWVLPGQLRFLSSVLNKKCIRANNFTLQFQFLTETYEPTHIFFPTIFIR